MKRFKESWTDKEYEEGVKYAEKYIRTHGGANNLGYAFISSDSYPGIKIIDNTPKGTPYTGVVVIETSTGKFRFISDEDINNNVVLGNGENE